MDLSIDTSYPRHSDNLYLRVNLNVSRNSREHKTDKYDISKTSKGLIVRRGQTFDITIDFRVKFDTQLDNLKLIFYAGKIKSSSKQTVLLSTERNDSKQWAAWILDNNDKLRIRIQTPPTCYVGIWNLEIETVLQLEKTKTLSYREHKHIYTLFNPWCEGDLVYIPNNHKDYFLDEYILEDNGTIYVGKYNNFVEKPWIFGQFDENILDCAMYLLDTHLSSWTERGNPTTISRTISKFVSSTEDEPGVLEGSWESTFAGGQNPSTWTSSATILNEYYTTKKPVKYGQCWVFSGLTTTICRTLGIPARSVTNFKSFHCVKGAISHNRYHGTVINNSKDEDRCSRWNFHVWNDVWMTRQNKSSRCTYCSGWQAIDATPQERSQGTHILNNWISLKLCS